MLSGEIRTRLRSTFLKTKNSKKLQLKKVPKNLSKNALFLFLGLQERLATYMRGLQPPEKTTSTSI
jgi:hypothetical protein